jgi:hypothetical protein
MGEREKAEEAVWEWLSVGVINGKGYLTALFARDTGRGNPEKT